MAEFLTTKGISYRLEEIIKNANELLVLISPYLDTDKRIKEFLADKDRANKDRAKVEIHVIYGKTEPKPGEKDWLVSQASINLHYRENLHAKCYLNEHEALLTSMNLYEFSAVNNDEMGIIVSREKDPELYKKIRKESMWLIRTSEDIRVTDAKVANKENGTKQRLSKGLSEVTIGQVGKLLHDQVAKVDIKRGSIAQAVQRKPQPTPEPPKSGFCIRCKGDVSANPTQPYCQRCHRNWSRFKNKEYAEKHCHTCGSEHSTTLLKPLCAACYRKYKDVFTFAVS